MVEALSNIKKRQKWIILGYELGNQITMIDDCLLKLEEDVQGIDLSRKIPKEFCNKRRIIKNSKDFLENKFRLNDVKYINEDFASNLRFLVDFCFIDEDVFLERLNKETKLVSPFSLPISYNDYSALFITFINDSLYNIGISLNKKEYKHKAISYIHEIGHSQLYTVKGSVLNYKLSEALPMFLELLFALFLDKTGAMLNYELKDRYDDVLFAIECIKDSKNEYDFNLHASSYVESSLVALRLFDLYINSNENIKNEIMNNIQNIFDAKITLDDMLNRYSINYENSKEENLFIKYIK